MLLSSSSFFFFFSLLPRPESGWHTFLSDGLHLTAAGNAFVFERLVEVIDAKHAEFKVRRVVTIHPYKQTNKQTNRKTDRQTDKRYSFWTFEGTAGGALYTLLRPGWSATSVSSLGAAPYNIILRMLTCAILIDVVNFFEGRAVQVLWRNQLWLFL